MKLKHWQGYGCVHAKKVSLSTFKDMFGDKYGKLQIKVWGNHEWGIENTVIDGVESWLFKRFYKGEYSRITQVNTFDYYRKNEQGLDEEVCDYTIIFKID